MTSAAGWLLPVCGGLALWLAATTQAGGREIWDLPSYWTVWLPLALLLSLLSGAAAPQRAWRWGLVIMLAQFPVVAATSGGDLGLWPLALGFLLLLSLPAIACALIGAIIARRLTGTA